MNKIIVATLNKYALLNHLANTRFSACLDLHEETSTGTPSTNLLRRRNTVEKIVKICLFILLTEIILSVFSVHYFLPTHFTQASQARTLSIGVITKNNPYHQRVCGVSNKLLMTLATTKLLILSQILYNAGT